MLIMKKKIRGGKRRGQIIANWRNDHSRSFNLDFILEYHYDYERVVHPWKVFVRAKTQPPARMRNEMIAALLDRYHHWNSELKNLGEPYYLKIWLYDQMFFESQIVAGIRDRVQWYHGIFNQTENRISFPYQHLVEKSSGFQWFSAYNDGDPEDNGYPQRNLVWVGGTNEIYEGDEP